MLEALTLRISSRFPPALNSPITEYEAYYYWSRIMEGLTNLPDFKQVDDNYQAASIRFTAQEIDALGAEDFLNLQFALQEVIVSSFYTKGMSVPEDSAMYLIPGDRRNVLVHELEHLDALPESLRNNSGIDVLMFRDSSGKIEVDGIAYYDMMAATNYENALAAMAPRSISISDIDAARIFAARTEDQDFINLIEQRIGERETHSI